MNSLKYKRNYEDLSEVHRVVFCSLYLYKIIVKYYGVCVSWINLTLFDILTH